MKKSKHFRKDVIIARIIFAILCIVIGTLIGTGVSALMDRADTDKSDKNEPNTQIQTEVSSQDTQMPTDPSIEDDTQNVEDMISYAVPTTEIRLRKEPNTNCEVLTKIPAGTKLTLLEELEGWYKVSYEGMEGYISADYATIETEGGTTSAGSSYLVMLDPGHQLAGDSTMEPNGPNSSEMKERVSDGTVGVSTGIKEYELTLEISLMLKEELEARGYTVLMTRETHDVNISNMERAQMANEAGADITVRIHGNFYSDTTVYGAEALAPSTGNPYVADIAEDSQKLSQTIITAYCDATGMKNCGVKIDDTMTGINWCEMPVTIIELGFLSNPTDDTNMQDDAYQLKMVKGMADGIDTYFGL